MKKISVTLGTIAAGLAITAGAAAGTVWNEVGDAGELLPTAQTPSGVNPLTAITGTLTNGVDVDLYHIFISNANTFMASTLAANGGSANFDTMIWLFDSAGILVAQNDDSGGTLQSTVTGAPGTGDFFLALSVFPNFPNSPQPLIQSPFTFLGGQFGGTLTGWSGGNPLNPAGAYTIALSGVGVAVVPLPGAAGLGLCGLAGLFGIRRRRA